MEPTERLRERVRDILLARDRLDYDDLPCACSSHRIAYRAIHLRGDGVDAVCDAVIEKIDAGLHAAESQHDDVHCVAWRTRPEVGFRDGVWHAYMRFHCLPESANKAFWGAVSETREGESAERVEASA